MAEEINELTQCPVCFESYDENGDHIPRILPCHCTLCQSCIGQLIKNNVLECPQDRTKHAANNGVKSFSQNKYILAYLKKEVKQNELEYDECTVHKMKLVLYCKENICQKAVCPVCMSEQHLSHKVVNILEEERSKLYAEIDPIVENLTRHNDEILRAKQQVLQDCENKKKLLDARKEEILVDLDGQLANSIDNLVTLMDIKDKASKRTTYRDIVGKMEFVLLAKQLSDVTQKPFTYKFYELTENERSLDPAVQELHDVQNLQIVKSVDTSPFQITEGIVFKINDYKYNQLNIKIILAPR